MFCPSLSHSHTVIQSPLITIIVVVIDQLLLFFLRPKTLISPKKTTPPLAVFFFSQHTEEEEGISRTTSSSALLYFLQSSKRTKTKKERKLSLKGRGGAKQPAMADNSKEEFIQLVKRFGAFLTLKISNLFQRMVISVRLVLSIF